MKKIHKPRSLDERTLQEIHGQQKELLESTKKQNDENVRNEIEKNIRTIEDSITNTTIEVVAGWSGAIPNGDFQNEKPLFSIKQTFSVNKETLGVSLKDIIDSKLKVCEDLAYSSFKNAEQRAIMKQAMARIEGLRYYHKGINQYISVTSILCFLPEDKINIDPIDLQQYAAAGTLSHFRLEHLAKTGYLIQTEEELAKLIPESHLYLDIIKSGNLRLSAIAGDLEEYLTKYPIQILSEGLLRAKEFEETKDLDIVNLATADLKKKKKKTEDLIEVTVKPFIETERVVFNDIYKYAGTLDLIGYPHPEFKGADPNKLTIFDLKRSLNKEKNLMQASAYAKAYELETGKKVEQMIIMVLNDKTEQGFSKPCISTEVDEYFMKFLDKRKQVMEMIKKYGYAVSF